GVLYVLEDTIGDAGLDVVAIRRAVGGPPEQGILEYIDSLSGAERAQAEKVLLDAEWRGAELATWMPNAKELVGLLHERRIPMAILTRNARDIAQATMERL